MGKSFQNINVGNMVHLSNRTVNNILHNLIPQILTCDGKDPPWIDNLIRRLIQDKSEA